jgi:hypothetical protein
MFVSSLQTAKGQTRNSNYARCREFVFRLSNCPQTEPGGGVPLPIRMNALAEYDGE